MPSGFIVLSDGRCFAPRISIYDRVLQIIASQLDDKHAGLRAWLLSLVPGPNDRDDLGYGPWFRTPDQQTVARYLDFRELTPENQRILQQAIRDIGDRVRQSDAPWPDWLTDVASDLADMVDRIDRGEPPLSRSDWTSVLPAEGRRIGPGWDTEGSPDPAYPSAKHS